MPSASQSAFSGSSGRSREAGLVGQAAPDTDELDEELAVVVWLDAELAEVGSLSPLGGGVGRGIGFVHGPLHPGGGIGTGVIPPIIPTSSGRQG